jgi:P-type Cu2+ transporter
MRQSSSDPQASQDGGVGQADHAGHTDHAASDKHDQHAAHDKHAAHAGHDKHTAHADHDKHAGHSVEMFRSRFWISLLLTIPTLVWGHMLADLTGYQAPHFAGSHWIAPLFGTLVFVYGGLVFIRGALRELEDGLPGMMTLISLAIVVAFVFSAAVTLGFDGMPLWEELATLVTIMLLGHWMEMRSIQQASGALNELAKLLPTTAVRVVNSGTEDVPVDALRAGDVVLIRPGAQVPADGVVTEGRSTVNESVITGESRPVDKAEASAVIAGTVNGAGSLRARVTGTGDTTKLAGIMRLVAQAQTSRSRAQALADRAAFWLTLIALGAGAVTLVAWLLAGATGAFTIERVVTVLVIACPHALGLAIPLVVAISTTVGARSGLLVRDRRGLEEARNLNAVIFDKTGTLTLGEHRVVEIATATGIAQNDALRLGAAVEQDSEHPVARAIVASAHERELDVPRAQNFESITGHGVRADVEGRQLLAGGPNLLRKFELIPSHSLVEAAERFASRGQSAIYLVERDAVLAVFAVADKVRPESAEAVRRLHDNGIEVVMLTGDARAVADAVAAELGIDTVFAEVLPEEKADKVRELQSAGRRVAMVGDGVNDAPALVTADVGIAIGAGTDVAVEAGDVVLVRSDPRDVARIVELSQATYRKMVQNLWWAAGYNIVAIPLAAGVLAGQGIVLNPAVGAVLMSLSTIIVALNAQLLRRVKL